MVILERVVFFIFLYFIYKIFFKHFTIRRIIMMAIFKGLK